MGELLIAISRGPECPKCGEDRFDDWHHTPGLQYGDGIVVSIKGRLKCHGCGRFFSVTRYVDGVTHSQMGGAPP